MPVNQPTDPGLLPVRRHESAIANRTRTFGWGYSPVPDVDTPQGPRNTGYVTSLVRDGQWTRGEMPMEGDPNAIALPKPKVMREPGSMMGTYPVVPQRDTWGNIVTPR